MRIMKWLRLYPAVDGELGRRGGARCTPGSYGPGGKLALLEVIVVEVTVGQRNNGQAE